LIFTDRYHQNHVNAGSKDWQQGYFGESDDQLQEVKAKWDPDNPRALRPRPDRPMAEPVSTLGSDPLVDTGSAEDSAGIARHGDYAERCFTQ
jgi:hypothetical protein